MKTALIARRRRQGANPLAAYTPTGGPPPDFVSDSVNDFYYSSAVGITDRATMYPASDGVIAASMELDASGGLSLVTRGLITYASTDTDIRALDLNIGGNPYLRFGILGGVGIGRAYIRMQDPTGAALFFETSPGTYAPGTDVPYAFGGTATAARAAVFVEGTKLGENAGTASSMSDFSASVWITQFNPGLYDEDSRIILMWEGELSDAQMEEVTPPFL